MQMRPPTPSGPASSSRGGDVPYATPQEFVADPAVVDRLGHLAVDPGLSQILSIASAWCDDYIGTPLVVHEHIEHQRMHADRDGRLVWFPQHRPFISLRSLTCERTMYVSPQVSIKDERAVIVDIRSNVTVWTGALSFGVSGELNTTWRYLAGYPNTHLTEPVSAGSRNIAVSDSAGIRGGDILRIHDEEIVVDSQWSLTTGPRWLSLKGPVQSYAADVRVSALPLEVTTATIQHGLYLITHETEWLDAARSSLDDHRLLHT